ncbi:cell division protein FtsL [Lutimaribacter marinistellae]|uniref:Cell division protein FtsL n=1 Tax=Lutimaribacter marinistellae TaxID=1820329 RepID=A0ABV7TL49_9RHOB
MKGVIYVLTALAVFGLALWAYQENYRTQQVLSDTQQLQREIGAAQIRLSVLRAEWAYLNRPDRLRELADLNFDRLGLLPLRPDQFGQVDQVAYPSEPDLPILNPVDVANLEVQQP